MIEAIGLILGMAMLAAMIAAIVGVVRGFRRKQWHLAIITGSIFAGLLVLGVLFMGTTGGFDEETETDAVPAAPVAIPAAPVPEPTAIPIPSPVPEPTAIPEPTATPGPSPTPVSGLGLTRGEIHRLLAGYGYTHVGEGSCFQTFCTYARARFIGGVHFWLYGLDDNLTRAMVISGEVPDAAETETAMKELVHILMPESAEAVLDWLRTDVVQADGSIQTLTMGDKRVEAVVSKSSGKSSLTIRLRE